MPDTSLDEAHALPPASAEPSRVVPLPRAAPPEPFAPEPPTLEPSVPAARAQEPAAPLPVPLAAPAVAPVVPARQSGCLFALSQPPLMIFLTVVGLLLLMGAVHDLFLA